MFQISFHASLVPPWTELQALRLGAVIGPHSFPDAYVGVKRNGKPYRRFDLYHSPAETHAFQEAVVWNDIVVIGFGEQVHLVPMKDNMVRTTALGDYFGHLYSTSTFLLVASASRLFCFSAEAILAWTTEPLGIDGVIVNDISDNVIGGEGEHDPPGGWRPFKVNLQTGELLVQATDYP